MESGNSAEKFFEKSPQGSRDLADGLVMATKTPKTPINKMLLAVELMRRAIGRLPEKAANEAPPAPAKAA